MNYVFSFLFFCSFHSVVENQTIVSHFQFTGWKTWRRNGISSEESNQERLPRIAVKCSWEEDEEDGFYRNVRDLSREIELNML